MTSADLATNNSELDSLENYLKEVLPNDLAAHRCVLDLYLSNREKYAPVDGNNWDCLLFAANLFTDVSICEGSAELVGMTDAEILDLKREESNTLDLAHLRDFRKLSDNEILSIPSQS